MEATIANAIPTGDAEKEKAEKEKRENRAAGIMKMKETLAQRNGVVFVGEGRDGYLYGKLLLDLNKYIIRLNSRIMSANFKEITARKSEIAQMKDEIWGRLKEILPNYYTIDPGNPIKLAALNDETFDEKMRYIQRRNSFIYDPADNNITAIITAVKILFKNLTYYRTIDDFGTLQGIVELLHQIKTDIEQTINGNTDAPGP